MTNIGYTITRQTEPFTILRAVSYEITAGETHLIFGPSGSGKTTFLQLMATFLKPTEGTLELFNKKVYPERETTTLSVIRPKISYLYQTPYLSSHLKVKDYLEIQALLSDIDTRTAQEHVENLLSQFGMTDFAEKYPKTLSGGEKQRLAIIGVLAKQADLVLLDEPTGSLDSENKTELLTMIRALKEQAKTIVIVSHDQALFTDLAEKKYRLVNKTLQEVERSTEIIA
jgi:ABC-type lipoprotein export system ATPase subunit